MAGRAETRRGGGRGGKGRSSSSTVYVVVRCWERAALSVAMTRLRRLALDEAVPWLVWRGVDR